MGVLVLTAKVCPCFICGIFPYQIGKKPVICRNLPFAGRVIEVIFATESGRNLVRKKVQPIKKDDYEKDV